MIKTACMIIHIVSIYHLQQQSDEHLNTSVIIIH